jgi:adenylate kinase
LVPDDIVIRVVAQRIEQPDARKGFILDGFPRTVPQAAALDRMLAERGLELDAVIELLVDEKALLKRIENRIAQMRARGEPLRDDDSAEVLRRRLAAYRDQTAPLTGYYRLQKVLRSVDGMASIPDVTAAVDAALSASGSGGAVKPPTAKPRGIKPKVAKPRAAKPEAAKAVGAKAVGTKAVGTKAVGTKAAGAKRKGAKPVVSAPTRAEPAKRGQDAARASLGKKSKGRVGATATKRGMRAAKASGRKRPSNATASRARNGGKSRRR